MKFSIFSAKFFCQLLSIKYYFVKSLEKDPIKCLEKLFNDYKKITIFNFISYTNFKNFIKNKINKIKDDYDLSFRKAIEIPDFFLKKVLEKGFDGLYAKYDININKKEEDEII